MSQNKDKPVEPDPDATVTSFRGKLTDEPDGDATVMMTRDALKGPDDDATVMMSRDALKEPDEDATVMMPPGGFKPPVEPAAAPEAPAPAILADEPSRMPMIAGGIVVVLVVLYFVMSKEKAPEPVAPKAEVAAPVAPPTAPAPVPAAPAPVAAAPVEPPAPAAATPAPAAATPTATPAAPAPVAAPSGGPSVKDALAAEAKRGTIAIAEEGGNTVITVRSTHQFASGGVDPEGGLKPALLSVAAALDKVPGTIVVIGHADAKPSSNPKFPSNKELSEARGQSAAKLMATKLKDPKRVSSEGASDSQPLAPSDTAENRAKNRRVVIVVKPAS